MDAEKFDKVVMDLLYDELDELTRASAIRHTEQSGRAKALYSELRATREVGSLPLVEPPEDLEARILAAEERARAERPLRQRIGAFVSIAASYAMRPQLGMAAVLMLMVGSSLLLLRAKPGEPSSVQVTERGVPETDKEVVAVVPLSPTDGEPTRGTAPTAGRASTPSPAAAAPRPRAEAARDEPAAKEREAKADRRGASDDEGAFAPPPPAAPPEAPLGEVASEPVAALEGASGAPGGGASAPASPPPAGPSGCESSLSRYEAILAHPPSAATASAVRWAAAECYARLGRFDSARRAYTALLTVPGYGDRAQQALDRLPPPPSARAGATKARPAATTERPPAPSKPEP